MLDQIRAIMKLMIVVSTVGLTKKLLRCRCTETFKTTSEISKSKLVLLIHARLEIWTLLKTKRCGMTTEIRIVSSTV